MSATVTDTADDAKASRLRQCTQMYTDVRWATEALCATLETEDYVIQSMPDCSPTKWHLAHTTWFFETFILGEAEDNYRPFHPDFAYLFNSYYVQAGERWQRPQRGLLSRPTVSEVYAYRAHVDQAMLALLENILPTFDPETAAQILTRIEIGLNHEQQHQELLLTDIKHLLSINPLRPVFRENLGEHCAKAAGAEAAPAEWIAFDEGIRPIGFEGDSFFYDNEKPRHRQLIPAFELASRTVTCGEYMEFMAAKGYEHPELWLSLGWTAVEANGWNAPLYWEKSGSGTDDWEMFTLQGMRPVNVNEPVTHISFFEADAYARWRGCDLPTEAMWEIACREGGASADRGNFVEDNCFHPVPSASGPGLQQMLGNVWEWTSSPYIAYPGYKAPPGALGEYNGKFMCNQRILRGGSCATPQSHIRPTYRNFFPPDARWQFSGIRLAKYVTQ